MKKRALAILFVFIVFTTLHVTIAKDSKNLNSNFSFSLIDSINRNQRMVLVDNQKNILITNLENAGKDDWVNFISLSDGANSHFIIHDITKYKKIKLTIYNSWGKKVYKSDNYQNDFDALNYPEGTYYYQAYCTLIDTVEEICKNSFFEVKRD